MLINWTRVRELRDEIGRDSFAEVVAIFLDESDTVVARASFSPEELHFLKGAALNLGFDELAEACNGGASAQSLVTLYQNSKASLLAEAL